MSGGVTTKGGAVVHKSLMFLIVSSWCIVASDVKVEVASEIPTDLCRPFFNTDVIGGFHGKDSFKNEFECMQQGKKDVWFGEESVVRKLPKQLQQYIQKEVTVLRIAHPFSKDFFVTHDPQAIAYTAQGKLRGLLLALHDAERLYADILTFARNGFAEKGITNHIVTTASNFYLTGYLLGYREQDIQFFYQHNRFSTTRDSGYNESYKSKPYIQWSPEQKETFTLFISTNKKWETDFIRDKATALAWVEKMTQLLQGPASTENIQPITLRIVQTDAATGKPIASANAPEPAEQLPTNVPSALVVQQPLAPLQPIIMQPTPSEIHIPAATQPGMPWWKKAIIATGVTGAIGALYKYLQATPSTSLPQK
jgi:hypothetical protein